MEVTPSRLRALETARRCTALGARTTTISYLSGLPPSYILHSVFSAAHPAPRGRPRYCEEFLFRAPARVQAEASLLAAHYRRLRHEGFLAADALICAFRHLRATAPACTLAFDEAFFLVCRLDGLWAAHERSLDLLRCVHCQRPRLVALGSSARDGCPICRTDWTRPGPPRPSPPFEASAAAPLPAPAVDGELARVSLMRLVQDLGAGKRVRAVLFDEPQAARYRAPTHRRTVTAACLGRPLRVDQWSATLSVPDRIRYAVFGVTYLRLQRLGLSRVQAMALAVARTRDVCRALCPPVAFDRCFEVAALLEGAWGVARAALVLAACPKCGSQFLAGTHERGPLDCPFCARLRRHRSTPADRAVAV